ncbi:hypothetical protein B7R22_06560 [Subtercola boreus]|uniref:Nucleotidyl transferase AbiEii/AbiGii toxin family protein n=1 Tax=Subtercola boreus TaxID=120213 RepID=A0A3E0W3E4_9MICO|nr:hypothetical protein B7R22_06560 [Subtercola boreus]
MQWDLTQLALTALRDHAFALAGSGAIREHGFTNRHTQDVDLFTNDPDPESFDDAVDGLTLELELVGLNVESVRRAPRFSQLRVTTATGHSVDMDLAVDWRQRDPVALAVGPVLSLEDAVGNKVSALYSRAEARDYLDVDAIRSSGRFTDAQLLSAVAERDAGFDVMMFASQLELVTHIRPERVERYGVSAEQLDAIRKRFVRWAAEIRS